MLRVFSSTNAEQAKSYFSNELTKGDYYTEGQEIAGVWGGSAAEWMGLEGTVTQADFNALIDNQFPEATPLAGEQITPHNRSNRRPGYDLTFNAPKALSLLYQYSQDERLLDVFRDAVHQTMESIEDVMHTRVRKDGKDEDRQTGNLAYAEFVHFTARPTEFEVADPHLHAHCYTMNLTFDPIEEQWKAGQFGQIKTDAPYYEALFHSHLTKSLSDMGYNIEREGKFWTIEELDESTIRKFSHRTEEIEKKAKELGIKTDKGKDQLGATTRGNKDDQFTMDGLREKWWERLDDTEKNTLDKLSKVEENDDSKPPTFTAEETVEYAIKHRLEKQSVSSLNRLKEAALRQGFGSVSPEEVEEGFINNDELLVVGDKATTKAILAMERDIITHTSNGYGIHRKLNANYEIGLVTDHMKGEQFELSDEQKNVVSTILESRNDIMAIQGKAGTGKTTTLATLIDGIEQGGGSAVVLAPTADAAYDTLKKDGEAYQNEAMQNAHTLARYLVDERLWEGTEGSTLIVDEAGLLSVDDMHSLFALADQNNNRVVMVGDITQHNSVMRGDAFRILQQEAGLTPVSLEEIRRQQGDYKDAVQTISEGKLVEGFDKLDQMGQVHVETNDEARYKKLATHFVDLRQEEKSTLTVAPTHAEGGLVNDSIREELKSRGMIKNQEHTLTRLHNTRLDEAQRGDGFNYEEGQVIRYQRNAKGEHGRIYKSSEFTVSKVDKQQIWMADENGNEQQLDLKQADKFQVYQKQAIDLAEGDHIRITEGHKSVEGKRLNNGAIYEVKGLDKDGNIKLKNNWVVDSSKGNFDHGYVRTSIASQGKTIDHIFLAQGADYAGAASTEQFYVSVSRGKHSVELYTDDKTEIREQIQRSHQRQSATELVKQDTSKQQQDMEAEDGFISTVGMYARNFYENMKEHAHNWLSAFSDSQKPPEPESTKWRDLVNQQREDHDRDISL